MPNDHPPTDDEVHLCFKYTKDDYVVAYNAHQGGKSPLFDGGVVAALILFAIYSAWAWDTRWLTIICLVVAGFFAAGRFVLPHYYFRWQQKLQNPYDLTFGPTGIHFQTANVDSQLKWSIYSRALLTPTSILLYYGKHQFTIIPKRIFDSNEHRERFERLISGMVPKVTRRV